MTIGILRPLLVLCCVTVAGVSAAADLAGRWEGEVTGARRPYRAELRLPTGETADPPELLLDGRYRLELVDLEISADRVGFRTNLNGEDLSVELLLADDTLRGSVASDGPPLAIELFRLPAWAAPRDRAETWAQDIETVRTRFLRFDRSFTPEAAAAVRDDLTGLVGEVDRLTDAEIIVRLSEAVARSGNAHTRLYLLRNRTALRRMPIRIHAFSDGWFVVQAVAEHADLLGCGLTGIGAVPIAAAERRVGTLFAGNAAWRRYKASYFLTSPEILTGTGIASDADAIYHVAQLALVPGVTLIGEPVGDVLDTWSEGGNLVLPNSGLTVHYTNGFHGYSTREYPERRPYYADLAIPDHALDPHATIATRFADYAAGLDPLLASVLGP